MILYNFCKYLTRFTSKFYYRKIVVSGIENVPFNTPLLLTINHPNSFLDAVLVGAYLNRPTYFLARGDAFKKKFFLPVLKSLNMLPLYRLSEGKENLNKNTETFDACQDILNNGKVVLIFPEGLSENNWELRNLKKGPARIAMKAWSSNTTSKDMQVLPVGLTYEHYSGGNKNILINIGVPVTSAHIEEQSSEAAFIKLFNQKIADVLSELIYINKDMKEGDEVHHVFSKKLRQLVNANKTAPEILQELNAQVFSYSDTVAMVIKQTLLFWPLYVFCGLLTKRLIKSPLFYDSVSFGLFLFLWPVYIIIIVLITSAMV